MNVTETPLPGLLVLEPKRHGDDRGYFSEVYNRETLRRLGIETEFVQDNHSLSRQMGTLRGLHYQSPPHAQAKLVRAGAGTVFDVAVDARRGSPTYGQWYGIELSAANGLQLMIPAGFLHGFSTRTPDAELLYKCSDVYAADCDGAVRFDDADIGIDWGLTGAPLLSDKDRAAQSFADFDTPFDFD